MRVGTGGLRSMAAAVAAMAAACALAQDAGEIVRLQGRGEHRPDTRAEWAPARAQLHLPSGAWVRTTQRESRMSVLLVDQTQLTLEGVSEAQVIRPDANASKKSLIDFVRGKGRFETKTPTRDFQVRTPTGLAAIRGTEWQVEVDADGTSRFTVVQGEIRISNPLGALSVGADEEGTLAAGRPPGKRRITRSRERIQWVSSFDVDAARYAELRGAASPPGVPAAALTAIARRDFGAARAMLDTPDCAPVACFLAADIAAYAGDLDAALAILDRARNDPRTPGLRIELLLARGDLPAAREAARGVKPDSVETALALGDLARLDGDYAGARRAFDEAIRRDRKDPRGWFAWGRLELERGHLENARRALEQAASLAPADAATQAQLARLELQDHRLAAARTRLEGALARTPDDFEAWNALGDARLQSGALDAANEALLKSVLIEPRSARAQASLAIAYWQQQRFEDALARLEEAMRRDPNDPLPWQLRAMMLADLLRPGDALEAAREALRRLPFAKSLDAIANDLHGSANLGAPLAQMGLEAWSMKVAQDSFDPLWAASHLFLGDRLTGRYTANSELLQGFLADPLAFGGSNRFQALVPTRGLYGTVALRAAHGSDGTLTEPLVNVNGLALDNRFAYFAEASRLYNAPGDAGNDRDNSVTLGLGVRPRDSFGAFLYANRLAPVSYRGEREAFSPFQRVDGWARRIDGGVVWRPDADAQGWLKAGASDEDSRATVHDASSFGGTPLFGDENLATRPRRRDVQARFTMRLPTGVEGWIGAEHSTLSSDEAFSRDAFLRASESQPRLVESVTQDVDDHARTYSAGVRARFGASLVEGQLDHARYAKTDRIVVRRDYINQLVPLDDDHSRDGTMGRIGVAVNVPPAFTVRGAYQRWLRPASTGSLAPSATAGVVLDDRYVLPGGFLERARLQLEHTLHDRVLVTVFTDRQRIDNLYSSLVGVLNNRPDSSNLERLRNRSFTPLASLAPLEGFAELSHGRLRETGVSVNAVATRQLSLFAEAVHANGVNDGLYPGARLAFLPRDRQAIGASWFSDARWTVAARAIHRGERFADEANQQRLEAEWNGAVQAYWETRDKRFSVELIAAGLGAKTANDSYAVAVNYRF